MTRRAFEWIVCGALLVAGVGAMAYGLRAVDDAAPGATYRGEFACYTSDQLSARHVEVIGARLLPDSGGLWAIYYADGPVDYYRQRAGEACRMEPVGPQGDAAP